MSQRILIKYKINCHSAQVKTLGVMVNVIGTPCFDTVSVYLLLEEMKFKLLLKIGKTGCVCVVECGILQNDSCNYSLFMTGCL